MVSPYRNLQYLCVLALPNVTFMLQEACRRQNESGQHRASVPIQLCKADARFGPPSAISSEA